MSSFLLMTLLVLPTGVTASNDGGVALVTVNCYELRVVRESSATPPPGPLLVFQLFAESAHHRTMPDLMKGKILAPEEMTGWVFGWSVSRSNELKLGWGDGTSAFTAILTMSGNKRVGTAQFRGDYEPAGPPAPLNVEMNTVSCNLAIRN